MLSVLLFLSLQTYQKDKLAYIFDSANSVANSLAVQTATKFKLIREQSELLFDKLDSTHKWHKSAADKFLHFESIDAILIFENQNISTYQERTKNIARQLLNSPQLSHWLNSFTKDQNQILYDKKLDYLILGMKKNNLLMLIFCSQDIFKDTIKKPGPFILSLIDKDNQVLICSDGINSNLQIPLKYHAESTTKTIKNGKDEEFLVAYSPISNFSLSLSATIKKKEAFGVLTKIIQQSILIFIMLVSICVIIGILISDDITSSLYEIFQVTQKITEGFFDIRVKVKKQDEVGRLAKSINLMVMEIKRLLMETKEKTRMEAELKTAQLVQSTFFPEEAGAYPNCRVLGKFEPASECCGDWWFHFKHNNKVYFIIADATGHGVSAALLTGAVRNLMNLLFKSNSILLDDLISLLNMNIVEVFKNQIMMTFLIAEFTPETRILKYINASHDPAFIIRKSEKPLNKKNFEFLNENLSPRIGENLISKFKINEVELKKEDRIFFYTDGILALRDQEKAPLNERHFYKLIIEALSEGKTLNDFVGLFHGKLKNFQKFPHDDDITFFMVEIE